MSVSRDRYVRNEILFREVNERVRDLAPATGATEYLCECGDPECTEHVELTIGDYEQVRSDPGFFVVVPGHEAPTVERVVGETRAFTVVEKLIDRDLTVETDPRRKD